MAIGTSLYDELRQSLGRVIEQRFDELVYFNGTDIPVTFDLEPGARSTSVDILRGFGAAALLAPGAADIPLTQVDITRDEYPVVMAASSYQVEFQNERSITKSGKQALISDRRTKMVYRAIAERLNRFAAIGDPNVGCRGLFNSNLVTVTNSSFNPNTGTFNDYVSFFMDVIFAPILTSNRVAMFNEVRIPQNLMRRALALVHPNDAKTTVLTAVRERLTAAQVNVNILERPECNSSYLFANGVIVADTKDRVLIYRYNEDSLSRQMENEVAAPLPEEYVQVQGTNRFFPFFSCASATQVHNLEDLIYVSIDKTT